MLVLIYQCHLPEDNNLNIHYYESLKYKLHLAQKERRLISRLVRCTADFSAWHSCHEHLTFKILYRFCSIANGTWVDISYYHRGHVMAMTVCRALPHKNILGVEHYLTKIFLVWLLCQSNKCGNTSINCHLISTSLVITISLMHHYNNCRTHTSTYTNLFKASIYIYSIHYINKGVSSSVTDIHHYVTTIS
jgi:hypothetical protein